MPANVREFVLMPRLHLRLSWGQGALYAVGSLATPLGPLYLSTMMPIATAVAAARRIMGKMDGTINAKEATIAGAVGRLMQQRDSMASDPKLADNLGLAVIRAPEEHADTVARIFELAALEAHGSAKAKAALDRAAPQFRGAIEKARDAWAETLVHDPDVSGPVVERAKARKVATKTGNAATIRHARKAGQLPPEWARSVLRW